MPPSPEPTLQAVLEVQRQLGQLMSKIDNATKDMGVVIMDLQGVKTTVTELKLAIGNETTDEDGKKTGHGIFGRVGRMENRQLVYDRWTNRAVGIAMAATVFGSMLWWLLDSKITHVLK